MSENASHKKGIDLDVLIIPKSPGLQPNAETPAHEEASLSSSQSNTQKKIKTAADTGNATVFKQRSKVIHIPGVFLVILIFSFAALFHQELYHFLGQNISTMDVPGPLGELIQRLETSSKKLNESTNDAEMMGRRVSSKSKIEATIQAVDQTKAHLSVLQSDIDDFLVYTDKHKAALSENGQTIFIDIAIFYRHGSYLHYTSLMAAYLDTMQKYLSYYLRHYEAIKNERQPQTESYESLYIRHKRMLGLYEDARSLNEEMMNKFIKRYPAASPLFPAIEKTLFF